MVWISQWGVGVSGNKDRGLKLKSRNKTLTESMISMILVWIITEGIEMESHISE